jgi:site-specific DNA-methyltransferase (adenine-specific)
VHYFFQAYFLKLCSFNLKLYYFILKLYSFILILYSFILKLNFFILYIILLLFSIIIDSIDFIYFNPPFGITRQPWDEKLDWKNIFIELFRISKNQIIWGGNYFTDKIPISRGWIYWDKLLNKNVSFADGELAWTSFDKVLKTAKVQYSGFLGADKQRIHPTQKPVALYKWLLHNYAKQGDKILDTHLGSGSSRIAAYDMGFDFTAFELDKEYFDAQEKRFNQFKSQLKLF